MQLPVERTRAPGGVAYHHDTAFRLHEAIDDGRDGLVRMLRSNQFAASPDGRAISYLCADRDGAFHLAHAAARQGSSAPVQIVTLNAQEARILHVAERGARLWVRHQDGQGETCVVGSGYQTRRQRLDELVSLRRAFVGFIPVGRNMDDRDEDMRYLLPAGVIPVHRRVQATIVSERRVLGYDPSDRRLTEWSVNQGVVSGRNVSTPPLLVDSMWPLVWRDVYAYVLSSGGQHALWVAGQLAVLDGTVECVWNSPTGEAIAMLVRTGLTDDVRGPFRKLVVTNLMDGVWTDVRSVCSGRFEMGSHDLTWSASGRHVAACVTHVELNWDDTVQRRLALVTEDGEQDIPSGFLARDPLVDTRGRLIGFLLDDGRVSIPVIAGVPGQPVRYAWNLRQFGNEISYNTFNSSLGCSRFVAEVTR